MARSILFHLDEVCDPRVAESLRQLGVDVTTAADADLAWASDQAQLTHALASDRVIVTDDTDYLRMSRAGASHAGIVYCPLRSHSVMGVIGLLALLWETLDAKDMRMRVEFL